MTGTGITCINQFIKRDHTRNNRFCKCRAFITSTGNRDYIRLESRTTSTGWIVALVGLNSYKHFHPSAYNSWGSYETFSQREKDFNRYGHSGFRSSFSRG
jgi:hypothetical protein